MGRLHMRSRPLALSWGAFLGVAGGATIVVTALSFLLTPHWPPQVACSNDGCKEAREWIAASVTLIVLLAGLIQYWRSQFWKRAEFVAGEMKAYLNDRDVLKVFKMIDWAARRINLFDAGEPRSAWPMVTREAQTSALDLHTIRNAVGGEVDAEQVAEATDSDLAGFTAVEAAIRDAYDAFLDGLERIASYIATGLLRPNDVVPYIGYWVRDITSKTNDKTEDKWTAAVIAYIQFYDFVGVQELFGELNRDIAYGGELHSYFFDRLEDRARAKRILEELDKHHRQSDRSQGRV